MTTDQKPLFFSRIAVLVTILMLMNSLAPLVSNDVDAEGSGSYPAPADGDWVVANETTVWNETIVLNGNLTIKPGGNLTLINTTIVFDCSYDGEFGLVVENGGELHVLGRREAVSGGIPRGDFDLFSGSNSGSISFFRNDGTKEAPSWTSMGTLEDGGGEIDVGSRTVPTFADLDNDGDFDLIIGEQNGNLNYYENTGTMQEPEWTEDSDMFTVVGSVGSQSTAGFADLDGDGDLDLAVGEDAGNLNYFENTGNAEEAEWTESGDMFDGVGSADRSNPEFADLDNDGDLDLAVGDQGGGMGYYYENTGTPQEPEWTRDDTMFDGVGDVGWNSAPALMDLDNDGDLDLAIGSYDSGLYYYENSGTPEESAWTENNDMFDGVEVSQRSCPELADIDGDVRGTLAPTDTDESTFIWHTNITTTGVPSFSFVVQDGAVLELRDTRVKNCGDGTPADQGLTVQTDDAFIQGSLFEANPWGVYLDGVSGVFLENNSFVNNTQGIHIEDCSDITVTNSTILSNLAIAMALGMIIQDATNITIRNSNITGGGNGITLMDSRNITLRDSNFTDCGLTIKGDLEAEFDSHTIDNNTIYDSPLYYYAKEDNVTVPTDAGGVILVSSSGAVIKGLDISSTDVGIYLVFSDDAVITDTSISDSKLGLHLYASDRANVTRSVLDGNTKAVVLEVGSADTVLIFNSITGSVTWGVDASANGGNSVDARKNFWGHISGPFHPTANANGKGGKISDDVLFDPWLRSRTGENIWYVNASAAAGGNGSQETPFQTIQEAVDMASNGETIMVLPGTYTENVVVDGKELDVVAEDHENTILDASGATGFELLGEMAVELAGLRVKNADIGVKVMGQGKSFTNLSFESTTTPFYLGAGVETGTRDCTFDNSALGFEDGNATLYERNTFHILVQDPYFLPVPEVQVVIKNKDGERIRDTGTWEDGTIGYILLPYKTHKRDETIDHGPYTVDLQKGKKTGQRIFDMDTAVNHIELWFESTKFGEAVAIGDINGDGVGDYAVGSPYHDGNGIDSGAVYIYLGGDHLVLEDLTPVNYDFVIYGAMKGSELGTSLALGGDLSGDGYEDLVVGAPYDNLTEVTGIRARYYHSQGENKFAIQVLEQVEETINYEWDDKPHPDVNADEFAVRWSGFINIEHSANYTFYTEVDDGVRFYLNEELLIESWESQGATEYDSAPIQLEPGLHEFLLEYYEGGGPGAIKLRWSADHINKRIIPAEVFTIGTDKDPGTGVVYVINGGESFSVVGEDDTVKERPLGEELELDSISSMVLEPEIGVYEFGKKTRYLGDQNGDGYPELGVLGSRGPGTDKLSIYHGAPLTQGHQFPSLIPQLPEADGEKDFTTLFFPGEWDEPVTGNGGLLTNSSGGYLSLDTSAGDEAYAYLVSSRGSKLGLDVSLEFRVSSNTNPVLSIMNYQVPEGDVGNSSKQENATFLRIYERGRAEIFQYPGAPAMGVNGEGLGDFMTVRVVVNADHDYLWLYFNNRLVEETNISGWDDELYLLVGDSSSEAIHATVELVWLRPALYAEYLNTDHNILSFNGGDITGDGGSELILSSNNTFIFQTDDTDIFPVMDDATKLFGNGTFNGTAYGGNTLTIAGAILNGNFDADWEHWTKTSNIRDEMDGTWELTTSEHGDWKVYDGPTASLGPDRDNVASGSGNGRYCDGKLVSDPFVIGQETEYVEFWHHAKWWSFEYADESQYQDEIPDFIAIRLVEVGSEDILAQLVYQKNESTGENSDGEEEGILQFDVLDHGGKQLRLEMEITTNMRQYDDALVQIDDIKVFPVSSGGSFVSQNITLEEETGMLMPQWSEENNNGNVSFKLRSDDSTEWENVSLVENGQLLSFDDPITQFQYRFDLEPGQDSPSPRIRDLQFIHFSENAKPLQLNTTGNYSSLTGKITDDDNWELLLHSGSLETVLVLDGAELKAAMDLGEAFFELDDYLMKLQPGVAEDSVSFGSQVSLISDIDGDKLVDILVSDPPAEDTKSSEGIVYAFYSTDARADRDLGDAAFQFPGGDNDGALGTALDQNLAGFPYAVRPRVEVLPSYLVDVSAATFNLDNTSMVYPDTSQELSQLVANIGFQELGDVDYQVDITAVRGGYTHSFEGTIPGILVDTGEYVNLSWGVPTDEDNSYYINISLVTNGDQDTSNNWHSVLVRSRYYRDTLESDRLMDSKRPNEYLSYNVTITNIGTLGDDEVSLGAEIPANWESVFRYQGNNVTTLLVSESETVEFLVRSPLDGGLVVDWAYNFTLNITTQSGASSQYLELEGYLVELDLVPVDINFYRRDGREIVNDTKHLVEGDLSTVEVVVKNQGNLSCGEFDVLLYRNETLVATLNVPSLDAGKSVKLPHEMSLPDGLMNFKVVVDPLNQCLEYTETNNELMEQTVVKDNAPENPYRISGVVYDIDGKPVEGADFTVIVEGYGEEFTVETDGDGKADIELSVDHYRDSSKLKVEAQKGSKYAYTIHYAYSEDGVSQDVELALMKYTLNVTVDSLNKIMYLNDSQTAYLPVDYIITINNTDTDGESFELSAKRPSGWLFEFIGNVTDIGAGKYEVTVAGKSEEEITLRVINRDDIDSPSGKNHHGNQGVNITFTVEAQEAPFSITRTLTTIIHPEDNLTIDVLNTDGKLFEKDERFYKNLTAGSTSDYIVNLINYGNTHKNFYLINEGENASYASIDVTGFSINCLSPESYRAEFTVTLTVPDDLREGTWFHVDILLIDENNSFSEYVRLGVQALKVNDVEARVIEFVSLGRNLTKLTLELANPTVNDQFVEFDTASFMNFSYTGNFDFSRDSLVVLAGRIATVELTIEQDDMGITKEGEDIDIRLRMNVDNTTLLERQLSYPTQHYQELTLSAVTTEKLNFHPGESYVYTLTLKNKGNGERDIASFTIDEEGEWSHAVPAILMERSEIVQIDFRVNVPLDVGNGVYNNITITPFSENGEAHKALTLVNQVEMRARDISMSFNDLIPEGDATNYTLRLRNDGKFTENIRAKVTIPGGYNYSITPQRFQIHKGQSKYISLRVEAPGDGLVFSNYTISLYPVNGDTLIAEITLQGLPVSRIDVSSTGNEYTFTAASEPTGMAEFLWEVNHGLFPLDSENRSAPNFTVVFERAGDYEITLTTTITDDLFREFVDRSTMIVTVENQKPDLSEIPGELVLKANELLVIDSADVFDVDGTVVDVMFSYNNTTIHATKFTTNFSEPGEYIITVTVVDNLGATTEKEVKVVVSPTETPEDEEEDEHNFSRSGTIAMWGLAILFFIVFGVLMFQRKRADDQETEALCQLDEVRIEKETGIKPEKAWVPEEPQEVEATVEDKETSPPETPEEKPEVTPVVEEPAETTTSEVAVVEEVAVEAVVEVEEEEPPESEVPEPEPEKEEPKAKPPAEPPAAPAPAVTRERKKVTRHKTGKRGSRKKQMSFKERAEMARKKK